MGNKLVLFVLGTRPEAIKLGPVIRAFQNEPAFETRLCSTAQHRELLHPFLEFFQLQPDYDLDLMLPGQSLAALTGRGVVACAEVFERVQPDLVFVQGDTSGALAAALAASLGKIAVAHVEAGLRSHRQDAPYPEEINRVLIGHVAKLHFAPGEIAAENLRREGITAGVHVVGNTVVDALKLALLRMAQKGAPESLGKFSAPGRQRKILLVTLHRRESFGQPLQEIAEAVRRIAEACPEVEIFLPVHLNPNVHGLMHKMLGGLRNVCLLAPLPYPDFIWLLAHASLVLSDSGGVLEEAETLGLPVLVAREVTERLEALTAGNARLVGFDANRIFAEARALLDAAPAAPVDPHRQLRSTFGDGYSAARIARITQEYLLEPEGLHAPRDSSRPG